MSGPKRNPDRLNTIGIVVVGICGAVLVYVSIVALQAFYLNDSSGIQVMADYGGTDTQAKSIRTSQIGNITEFGKNTAQPGQPETFKVPIDLAIKKVVENAKTADRLVPAVGPSTTATYKPVYGRPQALDAATPPADGAGAGSAAAPVDGAGAGSAATAGSTAVPTTPTAGQGGGGAGTGAATAPTTGNAPQN